MATLTGQSIASSYEQLLHVDRDGGGNSTTLVNIKDGDNGTTFALQLATDKIYVDGSVGIGTSSPTNQGSALHIYQNHVSNNTFLTVESDGANASAFIDIDTASDRDGFIRFKEAGTDKASIFNDASADALVLTDGANSNTVFIKSNSVGIGVTASADTPLHIFTNSSNAQSIFFDNDGTGRMDFIMRNDRSTEGSASHSIFFDGADNAGNNTRYATIENHIVDNADASEDGKLVFSTMVAGNDTETLNITGGNVGIGISPTVPLHISKATDGGLTEIFINNSAGGGSTDETVGIRFTHNGATAGGILAGRTEDFSSSANRSGHLIFKTNNNDSYAERMRLTSDGLLAIGSDSYSPSSYHGDANNLVVADSGSGGLTIVTGTTSSGKIHFADGTSGNARFRGFIIYDHNSDVMKFGVSGTERFRLDDNSRISLSNNDSSGEASSTFLGYQAGNAIASGAHKNLAIGHQALYQADAVDNSIAIGYQALGGTDAGTCGDNIAIGNSALVANMTHVTRSIAIGSSALGSLTGATTPSDNIGIGYNAGNSMTNCSNNVAIGGSAMGEGGGNAITGGSNTAVGTSAMYQAEGAVAENTAIGYQSMMDITTGTENTAVGSGSHANLTTGTNNVVVGCNALYTATTQDECIAIGKGALYALNDDAADGTVAVGFQSLVALTSGVGNTAVGFESLKATQTGGYNTALGNVALDACTGSSNTAVGYGALGSVVGGGTNIGIGSGAGNKGGGSGADLTTGNNNILIGNVTRVSASGAENQTVIGYDAVGQGDNSVTLGNGDVTDVYMAQDKGATVHCAKVEVEGNISSGFVGQFENDGNDANRYGLNVVAGADDGSGTTYYLACKDGDGDSVGFIANTSGTFALTDVSDQRLKKNIVDTSIKGIEKINQLKVRDFDWKKSEEKTVGGFIAQEVKDVFPQAVNETNTTVDGEENIMGVSRDMLVPLLIKAVQELSAKVTELENK
jgi:hypothetical protein